MIGDKDLALAQKLITAGSEHGKLLRMIHVQADFDMPRYWWSEFDTYHFNTKNSCSTMHKLLNNKNPITAENFVTCEEDETLNNLILQRLESLRILYMYAKSNEIKERLLVRAKRILPEGFLQLRTVDTNYAELRQIYFQRHDHRLKEEWGIFCNWVKTLPYGEQLITYKKVGE
jgi:predicted lipase